MPLKSNEPLEIELPDLKLVGACSFADFFSGDLFHQIGETWGRFFQKRDEIQDSLPSGRMFGLELYPAAFPKDRRWYYMACQEVASLDRPQPSDMMSRFIPAGRYLRFTHQGPVSGLAQSFRWVYDQWLPTAKVKLRGYYDLEHYDSRFVGHDSEESEVDILLPLA